MTGGDVRHFFSSLFAGVPAEQHSIQIINQLRGEFADATDEKLREICHRSNELTQVIAAAAVAAKRELGLELFDVQLQGALALANGRIAEMQTGEGKTLTAVPAVIWLAKAGAGVHVMTVNDYLARRDARWMGAIYERLGFSVGCIQQGMLPAERKRAYACDITYATANEIGFDYLRDQLALHPDEQVHRPFASALIDEADSILIDEARIPLVIAGGEPEEEQLAVRADRVIRRFRRGFHYTVEDRSRNVILTDIGIRAVEDSFACGNLYAAENLTLLTAVQDALHAHALLRCDVDYIVQAGAIESVDEFKGRVARDRRWPAGLHTAIEAKEGVSLKTQGRVLGSMTLQNLIALYPAVCGMTGTAATQAEEFRRIYSLDVAVIPTNRPMIRVDEPDVVLRTLREKEQAVLEEIRRVHATGRPVLIGTASVAESERLSALLRDIPHTVLNARHEELEAGLIARAGDRGAVTISTNMAGRGTDIVLGAGVAELGGLHVIGMNRHESRRIDLQLRGRAGRQGDPGSSRFFVSYEDDIVMRFGDEGSRFGHSPESVQRAVEGQNLDTRIFLEKYESTIEGQRQMIQRQRQEVLTGGEPDLETLVTLRTIDDLWSEYLNAVNELRSGVHWASWTGHDPLFQYLRRVDAMFREMMDGLDVEIERRIEEAADGGIDPSQRGATWTYLTTDQPFGSWNERIIRGLMRMSSAKR
jgi:preprotein translocase subunit SecA